MADDIQPKKREIRQVATGQLAERKPGVYPRLCGKAGRFKGNLGRRRRKCNAAQQHYNGSSLSHASIIPKNAQRA